MRIFPRALNKITIYRVFIIIFLLVYFPGFSLEDANGITRNDLLFNESGAVSDEAVDFGDENAELDIDELRARILDEAPKEFLSLTLGDANVSLFITGSWKIDLLGNFGFITSPLGTAFASPETPPFFKQEADLGLSLWINDKWFVEVNFLDTSGGNTSSLNTYRAGYQGFPGEFTQYAGIGNTGLDFPSFPYMDLGGDSISSFGAYSRFVTDNITFHALVRYDTASREERVFLGGRERITGDVQPRNSLRAMSFALPDENISGDIIVYIDDQRGGLTDAQGRGWRVLQASEHSVSRVRGTIELNIRHQGMIAVSYSSDGNSEPWRLSMGQYDGSENGFLLTVQNWFDNSPGRDKIKLENYPQCGGTSRPGETVIGGISALIIYENGTFSPFERRSLYSAPSGNFSLPDSREVLVITLSTGAVNRDYELIRLDSPFFSFNEQFDNEDIFLNSDNSLFSIYELLHTGSLYERNLPESLWPLAALYPEIYLPSASAFTGDLVLRFTNYLSVSGYFIGADVVPGSVRVWRNGIQHTGFTYSASTGEVTLNGAVSENELIRVTYLTKNEGTTYGSLAAGFGLIYENNAKTFSLGSAAGVRWNVSDESFTQDNYSSIGSAGVSAKASWNYDHLDAYISAGFNFLSADTTGLYRAAGMEGNEIVLAIPVESSFISNPPLSAHAADLTLTNRADLIYRNYNNTGLFGSSLLNINDKPPVISGINDSPYAAYDPRFKNQVLAAEFSLKEFNDWTGFQSAVIHESDFIKGAREIDIPFRLDGFNINPESNLKIIFQLGSLSGRNASLSENNDLIFEKIIFPSNSGVIDNGRLYFQDDIYLARFYLNDEDRLKLTDVKYIRVIIVNEGTIESAGRFILAPPIFRGASFRAITINNNYVTSDNINVSAVEIIDDNNSLRNNFPDLIKKLHPVSGSQRILKVEWNNLEIGSGAGIDGRIGELPLRDYNELSFFFMIDKIDFSVKTLNFIIGSGPENISDYRLKADIPISAFTEKKWHKITIRYQGSNPEIYINGIKTDASVSYTPFFGYSDNNIRRTSYIALFVSPEQGIAISDNRFFIDEIILEDANFFYRINSGAGFNYRKNGAILTFARTAALADFNVSAALESETSIYTVNIENPASAITGRMGIGFSLFGADLKGEFSFTSAFDNFIWSAGHDISRNIWLFFLRESFFASPDGNTARHQINLSFQSKFFTVFDAEVNNSLSALRQRWKLNLGLNPDNIYIPVFNINAEAIWQKKDDLLDKTGGYGELWLKTWQPLVPDTGKSADTRRTQTRITITQRTQPVGAVLSIDGRTSFISANNTIQSNVSSFLDIPLIFERSSLNFRFAREFSRNEYFSFIETDALDDGKIFFNNMDDWFSFWKYFPLYSLFSDDIRNEMEIITSGSSKSDMLVYSGFNDHFSARFILPPVYNLTALIVPSRITLRMERNIEKKLDTLSDSLNFSGNLLFSAINMFGAMGYLPLFNFYMTDDFSHSIETTVNIARNEKTNWGVQSKFSAGFRGFTAGTLEFNNLFTYRSNGNWSENFTMVWEAPVKRNLLSVFYDWATGPLRKNSESNSWNFLSTVFAGDYTLLRKETLELYFGSANDEFRFSVAAGHEEIIRILGQLNLSSYIKLRISETTRESKNKTFSFDALLGVSMRIMF
ncbi:MAG: hypothetical protein FWC21_00540 [Treponema sp.]|nr:hypothetical protein [Treponema sp.]